MSSRCEQIKQEYETLKSLKKEFDLELEKATTKAGTPQEVKQALQRAKEVKAMLEQKRDTLKKKVLDFKWSLFDKRILPFVEKKKEYKNTETLEGHTGWVLTLQVLPDGRIVSGGSDETIKIWTKKGDEWEAETLEGHTGSVLTLQVLPDGRIVSGNFYGKIQIWDGKPA